MRNKILSTAIAGALSMGVHGVAQAQQPVPEAGKMTSTTYTFATELFPTDTSFPEDKDFVVTYRIINTVSKNFYATFTLSGGSWGNNLDSSALMVTNSNVGVGNSVLPALVDLGEDGDNSVTFLVPLDTVPEGLDDTYTLTFSFKLDDAEGVLASPNNINIGVEFPYAPDIGKPAQVSPTPFTIASSVRGNTVEFELNSVTTKTFIDVAQDNKQFVNGIDETTARLGYLKISGSTIATSLNTSVNYLFNGTGGTLEITSGVFSASDNLGENVFLDINGDGVFTDGTDIPADEVTATTATWKLTADQIYNATDGYLEAGIVVKAIGTTEFEEQEEAAQAVLVLDYPQDSKAFPGRLEYIKRNGTRCKAYNVPYPGKKDNAFFRFTSKTNGIDGVVKGTLYKEDGTKVASDKGPDGTTFTDVDLLQLKYAAAPTLTANQTKVVSNQDIADLATEEWTGRATLVINSNLTNMEMLALLRNQQGVVGPLMNLSTGATGTACD